MAQASIDLAVRWDLSALFSSMDDPKIEATWETLLARARAFGERFRGQIDRPELKGSLLLEALAEFEAIHQESAKPICYAHLLFAGDTSDPKHGAFLQKQSERATELSVSLLFFELELQAATKDSIDALLEEPGLAKYVHFVNHVRMFSPFRLSEKEEIIFEETANTGSRAWQRLFEEVTSNHVYEVPGPVGPLRLSQEAVLDRLRDPDREVRREAAASLTKGLATLQRVLTFIYNTLLQDKSTEDRLRGYESAELSRHLSNELEPETVNLVVRLCKDHYGLVARFYEIKRQILGLPSLTHIDRYAPLFESSEEVEWERARSLILDSFGGFSGVLADRAQEFFDKGWIDAEPRPGKRGGAFCMYNTPDTHPVVLQSYLGKMDDVMTLAHELGHGVHASLSRGQSYFNFHGTLPLAELASTFGEMLVFEKLVSTATLQDKLALYAEKLESIFATVFRQAAMYRFEQRCHAARRTEGELEAERIGEFWQEELQSMFGSSLTLGAEHRMWWSYVSHFINSPFYVYAYSFGELLVLSLVQMAKEQGSSFSEKYIALLQLGGSLTPKELMATVGIDLTSEDFWIGGFKAIEGLIAEFEMLWSQYEPMRA